MTATVTQPSNRIAVHDDLTDTLVGGTFKRVIRPYNGHGEPVAVVVMDDAEYWTGDPTRECLCPLDELLAEVSA